MNRRHRRAERAACRDGAARVPRRVYERKATEQEVKEVAVAYKIVKRLVFEHKEELRNVPPAAVASVLLDSACMFLAGAHLQGESIDWDRVRYAMRESFTDHLNKLRKP